MSEQQDLLSWESVKSWAESLEGGWLATPGSCITCPIAQYLNESAQEPEEQWIVSADYATQGYPGCQPRRRIDLSPWVKAFIDTVDKQSWRRHITKSLLLAILDECKPESEASE